MLIDSGSEMCVMSRELWEQAKGLLPELPAHDPHLAPAVNSIRTLILPSFLPMTVSLVKLRM